MLNNTPLLRLHVHVNQVKEVSPYYWQEYSQGEIDFIIEYSDKVFPVEVKSAQTLASGQYQNLKKWIGLTDSKYAFGTLIYGGEQWLRRDEIQMMPWFGIRNVHVLN